MKSFFDAVFFDMDGLLVDSEPEWLKSESEITAAYGYEWNYLMFLVIQLQKSLKDICDVELRIKVLAQVMHLMPRRVPAHLPR